MTFKCHLYRWLVSSLCKDEAFDVRSAGLDLRLPPAEGSDAELRTQEDGPCQASAGSPALGLDLRVLKVKPILHSSQQPLRLLILSWGPPSEGIPEKTQSLLSLGILVRPESLPFQVHNSQLGLYTCLYFIGGEGIKRKLCSSFNLQKTANSF